MLDGSLTFHNSVWMGSLYRFPFPPDKLCKPSFQQTNHWLASHPLGQSVLVAGKLAAAERT